MPTDWKQIEINIEVHRALEARREAFHESYNDILLRVLEIENPQTRTQTERTSSAEEPVAWRRKGVTLPSGTRWRLLNGSDHDSGEVANGYFRSRSQRYKSPSGLAMALYRTKEGRRTNLNGWRYIEVLRPQDKEWVLLNDLFQVANE